MDGFLASIGALAGVVLVIAVAAAFVVGVVVRWIAEWRHRRAKARRLADEVAHYRLQRSGDRS